MSPDESPCQVLTCYVPDSTKRTYLALTPCGSLEEFWLPLRSFDYGASAKNGCGGYQKSFEVFDVGNV